MISELFILSADWFKLEILVSLRSYLMRKLQEYAREALPNQWADFRDVTRSEALTSLLNADENCEFNVLSSETTEVFSHTNKYHLTK